MSASERLKALEPEGLVETTEINEGYTDAVCLSIPAHAAVVAAVEAAEATVEFVDVPLHLSVALAALEETLS